MNGPRLLPQAGLWGTLVEGLLSTYSGRTREGYAYDLAAWEYWCGRRGIDPLEASRLDIEAWAVWSREEAGLRPRTVCTRLAHVCGLYRWAASMGLITHDPGVGVRRPRCPRPAPRQWLGPRDLRALLRAGEESETPGDGAIAHLLGVCDD